MNTTRNTNTYLTAFTRLAGIQPKNRSLLAEARRAKTESKGALGRIWRQVTGDRDYPVRDREPDSYALLTSYRNHDEQPNRAVHFDHLKKTLRKQGYGYRQLDGAWDYTKDDGSVSRGIEKSLMVPKITYQHAHDHALAHNQDSFIYSGPETEHRPVMYKASRATIPDRDIDVATHYTADKDVALAGQFEPGEGFGYGFSQTAPQNKTRRSDLAPKNINRTDRELSIRRPELDTPRPKKQQQTPPARRNVFSIR